MNQAKIDQLKQAAKKANDAYSCEKARLVALGMKSQERYTLLKELKAVADSAHAEYVKYTHGQIKGELDKIIAADLPARQAAARARSAWKQAKFEAALIYERMRNA